MNEEKGPDTALSEAGPVSARSEAPGSKTAQNEEAQDESPIATEIERFVNHLNSLGSSLAVTMFVMNRTLKYARKLYDEFVGECEVVSIGPPKKFRVSPDRDHEYIRLEKQLQRSHIATSVVPKSFVVALVSQFDAYLGGLVRAFINLKPELLNGSERILTFKELKEFNSLEGARDFILEKEIESLLRESHPQQFSWMENKFKIKLTENLPSWPTFVEVTERRNLFVHCDGVVSRQYLKVCGEQGVEGLTGLQPGSVLWVSPEYFSKAQECILEIGVKLGHVLWRKLCPEQRAEADANFSDVCFGLLQEANYRPAKELLNFAVTGLKKHSTDEVRRIFVINYAQAQKWVGDQQGCVATLEAEDWTACDDKFQIAIAVLKDDFDRAIGLVGRMGPKGQIEKSSYRSWPIFQELRKRKDFREAYSKVFGEEFEKSKTEAAPPSEVGEPPADKTIN